MSVLGFHNVRISPDKFQRLKQMAKAKDSSVTREIDSLIDRHVKPLATPVKKQPATARASKRG